MEPGIPSRFPSIQPFCINHTSKNATVALTCAPSPKQSTRDWIQILGEIGWARPSVAPLGWLPTSSIDARGIIWPHIQILLSRNS